MTSAPAPPKPESTLAMLELLLNGPALKLPTGVNPHLDNHWNRKHIVYIVTSLCMAVMALLIIVRTYTKLKVIKKVEIEDYFIIASYLISINVLIFTLLALPHGWGAHQWNVQLKHLFKILYYINVLEILYGPLALCVKFAVILQYLRIFAPNRTVNPFVYFSSLVLMTACAIFYIITTFLTVFACTPREKICNKLYIGGHCMNYRGIIISTAFFNIISDVAILLLPVGTVWKMSIPTKKKISIILLFCTGLTACVASAMRAYYTMRIINGGAGPDVSYNSVFTALWSYAECTLGVIVACTLSIPKLIQAKGAKLRACFSGFAKVFSSSKLVEGEKSAPNPLPSLEAIRLSSMELKEWPSDSDPHNISAFP